MLDQNTDRMWYVIGAVLVGAAIILIANGTLPQMFASVTDSFSTVSENAVDEVGDININLLHSGNLGVSSRAELVNIRNGHWTVDVESSIRNYSSGLIVLREKVNIPYGKQFNVSYEVKSPIKTDASTDISSRASVGESWRADDNDNHTTRRFNGEKAISGVDHDEKLAPFKAIEIPANEWTTVTFSYANTSEENIDKVPIYDYSLFGIRNSSGETVQIEIRNVKGWISDITE